MYFSVREMEKGVSPETLMPSTERQAVTTEKVIIIILYIDSYGLGKVHNVECTRVGILILATPR